MYLNIMLVVPYELIYEIYEFADMKTRINMNRALNISYKVANPLSNIQMRRRPKTVKKYSPFDFIMRGH